MATSERIYSIAANTSIETIEDAVKMWKVEGKDEKVSLYNSLMQLGDSQKIAYATAVMHEDQEISEMYRVAYSS